MLLQPVAAAVLARVCGLCLCVVCLCGTARVMCGAKDVEGQGMPSIARASGLVLIRTGDGRTLYG